MHALIVGRRGVGKSTLIHRVLQELGRSVSGYETKKEDALADAEHGIPVYIYEAGACRQRSEENLLGCCRDGAVSVRTEAFDRYARKLAAQQAGEIILLDEIGFMETKSSAFCRTIMELLDGRTPVLAAVKDKDIPFLEAVRTHPHVRCFLITEANRDALYEEVLTFMKQQLEGCPWHAKP